VGTVSETDFGYTGQRALGDLGLMDYHARMYDPLLMRFIQPDTIIPSASDPQTWDRYSYVYNNPVDLTDPTGNFGHRRDRSGYMFKRLQNKISNLERKWHNDKVAADAKALQDAYYTAARADASQMNGGFCDAIECSGMTFGGGFNSEVGGLNGDNWWNDKRDFASDGDYWVLSGTIPIPQALNLIGIPIVVTFDRYGNVYIGAGGSVGPAFPFAANISEYQFFRNSAPSKSEMQYYLKKWTVTGSIGFLIGGSLDWQKPAWRIPSAQDVKDIAQGRGIYTPQLGVGVTYSCQIYPSVSC